MRPGRRAALLALGRAVAEGQRPGAPGIGDRLRALPRLVGDALSGRYDALGRTRLAMIGLALAYLASPVDLVPEVLVPLIGLADDGLIALWLAGAFVAETDRFLDWERTRPAPPVVVDGSVVR
jgi:uncharacterized membrane protein YkvA (DUF1232 family)